MPSTPSMVGWASGPPVAPPSTGLFRTATNRNSFENMLAILSRTLRMESPAAPPPAAALPQMVAPPVSGAPEVEEPELEVEPEAPKEIQLPRITIRHEMPKAGRNDPCPCGSGKKFKNCHGK